MSDDDLPEPAEPSPRSKKRQELMERIKSRCPDCAMGNAPISKQGGLYQHASGGACTASDLHEELDNL